ncbi:MAG: 50S ribosomal protein L15 [candidate division Zixibacteria bacterium]|nr:50S ribosomal protein L15 [candidate division Zixibacteria bacterium]
MKLGELKPSPGARKARKRVGRGPGSDRGKTCGRGHKGQKSRAGAKVNPDFEGGQMPLQRRLPKRGFTNVYNKKKAVTAAVNVGDLARFGEGATIDLDFLKERKAIKTKGIRFLRVIGGGELNAALTVRAHYFSPQARAKIEAAGGKAEAV